MYFKAQSKYFHTWPSREVYICRDRWSETGDGSVWHWPVPDFPYDSKRYTTVRLYPDFHNLRYVVNVNRPNAVFITLTDWLSSRKPSLSDDQKGLSKCVRDILMNSTESPVSNLSGMLQAYFIHLISLVEIKPNVFHAVSVIGDIISCMYISHVNTSFLQTWRHGQFNFF